MLPTHSTPTRFVPRSSNNERQISSASTSTGASGSIRTTTTRPACSTSGHDDLVDATANDRNFVKLADVTTGPLVDWILTSGLTQEEAVMIQQPTEEEVEAEEQDRLRAIRREDRRLAKNYIAVERALKEPRIADAGLDVAVARLVARPELAAQLLAATPAPTTP
jgi:hypothetical protein